MYLILLDKPIQYEYSPRRSGDPGEVFADNSLAKSELNWSCAQSLEKCVKIHGFGIQKTYNCICLPQIFLNDVI